MAGTHTRYTTQATLMTDGRFSVALVCATLMALIPGCGGCDRGPKVDEQNQVELDEVITKLGGTSNFDAERPKVPILTLDLSDTETKDSDLDFLPRLPYLKVLMLSRTRITDSALAHLAALLNLENLELAETKVSDAGLANLAGLTDLVALDLSQTQVTNNGLTHLMGLENLRLLDLSGSRVTAKGIEPLQQARPNLSITGFEPEPDLPEEAPVEVSPSF